MYIRTFCWDEENEDHIGKHGVSTLEVEEAISYGKPFFQRAGDRKYLAYVVTEEGRYLLVVFSVLGKGEVKVITARDMTKKEKYLYGRQRRRLA